MLSEEDKKKLKEGWRVSEPDYQFTKGIPIRESKNGSKLVLKIGYVTKHPEKNPSF